MIEQDMQKPIDFSNLFLDMNAFFASVEQQVQPPLRGKPICVAPYTGDTGCCIAKSYEAKALGVATGHLVRDAKKICPQIIILESRPELYLFYHHEILKVLNSLTPYVRVLSVDEFNIKLSPSEQNYNDAINIAQEIKIKIKNKVGDHLKCSIGIAPNLFLAKTAGESKKPDGLTVLTLKNLEQFYEKIDLLDIPGVNFRLKAHLEKYQIKTALDFYHTPLPGLSRILKHLGKVWFFRLRGYETDEIETSTKSISSQHVLSPKYRNLKASRQVLSKLAQKCSRNLRSKKMLTGGISIHIRCFNLPPYFLQMKTNYLSSSADIQKISLMLFDRINFKNPPFKLEVRLFNLVKTSDRQMTIFPGDEKKNQISRAIDKINDQFGEDSIFPASMCDTFDAAPNRIAFGPPEK